MRTKDQEAQRAMRRLMWWYRRPFLCVLNWLVDGHIWALYIFGTVFVSGFIGLTILKMLEDS